MALNKKIIKYKTSTGERYFGSPKAGRGNRFTVAPSIASDVILRIESVNKDDDEGCNQGLVSKSKILNKNNVMKGQSHIIGSYFIIPFFYNAL